MSDPDISEESAPDENPLPFDLPDGRTLTAQNFRDMAEFCNHKVQQLSVLFEAFKESFRTAGITFLAMEKALNDDADAMKEYQRANRSGPKKDVEFVNVFDEDPNLN